MTASCQLLHVDSGGSGDITYGLFCGTRNGGQKFSMNENIFFDGDEFRPSFQASRAFAILNCIALSLCFVGVLLMIFFLQEKASRLFWLATRILFCVALIFTLGIFLFFDHPPCKDFSFIADCSAGPGAFIHWTLVIVQVALVILAFMTPIPPYPVIKSNGCCCCTGLEEEMTNDQNKA